MASDLFFPWMSSDPKLLVFASPGRVDEPGSCNVRCKDGYFRLTSSQPCRKHSTPSCAADEYRRAGDHARDATCLRCSGCAGQRLLAACNATSDDICEECGTRRAHQLWVTTNGSECNRACESGFELNSRTKECELCQARCAPGQFPPPARHNCTHCEACVEKPANSEWLTQDDRFDCAWQCEPKHMLVDSRCVPWTDVFVDTPTYDTLKLTCKPGQTLVDFKCTDCFEAARTGAVRSQDLPDATQSSRWSWVSGCHWQCRQALGFTALRSETGQSWMCVDNNRRAKFLQGPDTSWVAAAQEPGAVSGEGNTPGRAAARTSAKPARTLLAYVLLVLAAVPVLTLQCSLLVHCVRRCKRDMVQRDVLELADQL